MEARELSVPFKFTGHTEIQLWIFCLRSIVSSFLLPWSDVCKAEHLKCKFSILQLPESWSPVMNLPMFTHPNAPWS